MEKKNDEQQTYEAPELFELGRFEELTLNCKCGDACDCEGNFKQPPPPAR